MALEKVLIFDVETSGTDPEKDEVVEAAGALFSVKHATAFASFSWCLKASGNAAAEINGIAPGLLEDHGAPAGDCWKRIEHWMSRSEAVIAHNGRFDRSFCPQPMQGLRPWICSLEDIEWPRKVHGSRVVDVALAHGVGVTKAHRALSDVLLLCSTLERVAEMGVDLGELLSRALRPKRRYRAVTGKFDPALNEKLKAHAFRWDPEAKAWWRRLVVEDVPRLQAEYPFSIVEWAE